MCHCKNLSGVREIMKLLNEIAYPRGRGAVLKGTIINYSENPTVIGNATLNFDRPDNIKVSASFDTHHILTYSPAPYEELAL